MRFIDKIFDFFVKPPVRIKTANDYDWEEYIKQQTEEMKRLLEMCEKNRKNNP